jgi:hypothetical protein
MAKKSSITDPLKLIVGYFETGEISMDGRIHIWVDFFARSPINGCIYTWRTIVGVYAAQ